MMTKNEHKPPTVSLDELDREAIAALTAAANQLSQALALLTKQLEEKYSERWMTPNLAARELGVTAKVLDYWRESPEFEHGIHYRSIAKPGAVIQRWQYNVPQCRQALAKPPEKRKAF